MGIFDKFKRQSEPRVQLYDPETGTVLTIPARELAPGMVRVQVDGIDGECWMDPAKAKQSDYRHPSFDDETRRYLQQIKDGLDEVYSLTLDQWEDGFRRDNTPEREIAIWLYIAEIYQRCTAGKDLSLEEKRDVFKLVLSCANNPREHAITVAGVNILSKPEAEEIVKTFYDQESDGK